MDSKANEFNFLKNSLKILIARIVEAQRIGDEEKMLDLTRRKTILMKRLSELEKPEAA